MNLQQKQSLIFKHYGLPHQLKKLKGELQELTHELNISIATGKLTKNFASELADVRNLCDQIAMHISQCKINKIQHEKCDRQLKRMESEGCANKEVK